MGTGQTLFVLGAMALLSTVIISMYRTFITSDEDLLKSEIGITAVSLATSLIEEAQGKAFDTATDTSDVTSLSQLTAPASLGKEAGDVYPDFNDFDDFNNYSRVDSTFQRTGKFFTNASVVYIDPAAPNNTSSVRTWNKKLTVTVTSPTMQDTIRMYCIFSYWYFR